MAETIPSFHDDLENLRKLLDPKSNAAPTAELLSGAEAIARRMQFSMLREQITDISQLMEARDLLRDAKHMAGNGQQLAMEILPALGLINKTVDQLKDRVIATASLVRPQVRVR